MRLAKINMQQTRHELTFSKVSIEKVNLMTTQKNILILALFFTLNLGLSPVFAQKDGNTPFSLFPRQRLFTPRLADPSEVQLSAKVRTGRREFNGNIGYSVGLLQFQLKKLPIQLRIEGNTFIVLKIESPDFPVQSTDYTLAFPLDIQLGAFSSRLMWTHISSHLGDDFNRIDDVGSTIVFYGDESAYFSKPKKFSREFLQLFGAVNTRKLRLYSGLIWAYHIVVSRLETAESKPWSFQAGMEWHNRRERSLIYPFMAIDFKSRQELNWNIELNWQTGFIIGKNRLRRMRLALEIFSGYSNQGQFLSRKERDINMVMAFDY